ncbi:MAG: ABC transporter substrate-binding protein [Bacteroidaceae bacterium]|nr:ABC transporter substrate-binding protein [Bacteroidaceae bacterium]
MQRLFLHIYIAVTTTILCSLTACRGYQPYSTNTQSDTLELHHAEHLTIIEHKGYTEVQIHNPWKKGKLLQTVLVQSESSNNSEKLPNPVLPPPHRILSFTATHSNLIEELGCIDAIAGICETEYVANPQLRQAIADGKIKDIGSAMTPDRERIIGLAPDLILLSPYENASTYGQLEALGIPIIQCADYMETSALGRAEWIRFYGRLFGKPHEADSLYLAIEAEYHALRALTDSINETDRPTILFDTQNGSAWYLPGGRSTMAQLISDAGGRYLFDDNTKSGSIPLAFETVLSRGGQADIWLIRYSNSHGRMGLNDLGEIHHPYTLFKAYQKENVYGCNTTELIFYEETPFHPERLLLDYIKILHPQLLPDDKLRYFHQL